MIARIAYALFVCFCVSAVSPPLLADEDFKEVTIQTTEGTWMNLDVSPDGNLIAFQLLGNIFTLPLQGGEARQLTEGPAYHEAPQFSADGRYVVFGSDRGGFMELWQLPVAGGQPRRVLPEQRNLYLAPEEIMRHESSAQRNSIPLFESRDGRFAVHHSRLDDDTHIGCRDDVSAPDLVLIDQVKKRARRLLNVGPDCNIPNMPRSAFTPDGAFITSYSGKLWRINLPAPEGPFESFMMGETVEIPFTAHVRLKMRPLRIFPQEIPQSPSVQARRIEYPILSPDGKTLAFTAFHRVWVKELPSGTARRVTDSKQVESDPVWSPDGAYLAYSTWSNDTVEEGHVYRVRLDDGCRADHTKCVPQRLTTQPARYRKLTFSADGARIFAEAVPTAGQISQLGVKQRRITKYGSLPEVEMRIVAIPTDGGSAVTIDEGQYRLDGGDKSSARFQVRTTPQGEQLVRSSALQGRYHYTADAVVARRVSAPRKASSAKDAVLLKIEFPSLWSNESAYSGLDTSSMKRMHEDGSDLFSNRDILLSPTGKQALILFSNAELFLLDVPPARPGGASHVVFDTRSPRLRRVNWRSSGADYAQWSADGRSFTFSFGNTFYIYDLERAKAQPDYRPEAHEVNVSLPRDLPTGLLALRNARLITMRGDEVIERGDVLVRDRRIVAIGSAGTLDLPAEAAQFDLTGKTVIPGLLDMHNHDVKIGWNVLLHSRMRAQEANLALGVLTSKDPQDYERAFMTYEDRMAVGDLLGPRYMNTGAGINIVAKEHIDSMNAAREIVARYADIYRVKFLKEYGAERRNARRWLVRAAAERGLNIASHGHGFRMLITNAIDGYAGYDHFIKPSPLYSDVRALLVQSGMTLSNQGPVADGRLLRHVVEGMDDASTWTRWQRLYDPEDYNKLRQRADDTSTGWFDSRNGRPAEYRPGPLESSTTRFVAEGGRIATGGHGDFPGLSTHLEMHAFVLAGLPPHDALRAGTIRGAELLGLDRDLGALDVGKLADLVVLDGNPLEDIRNTLRTRYVLFNGRLRDAYTLEEVWPKGSGGFNH